MGGYQLLDKDYQVFDFIDSFRSRYGFSPSVREMAKSCEIALSSVEASLRKLKRCGFVDYIEGQGRTVVIVRYRVCNESQVQTR